MISFHELTFHCYGKECNMCKQVREIKERVKFKTQKLLDELRMIEKIKEEQGK